MVDARVTSDEQSMFASCPDCATATDLTSTPAAFSNAANADAQSQSAATAAADADHLSDIDGDAQDSLAEYNRCSTENSPSSCSGTGASWTAEEPMTERLEGRLQGNWARAMALARAALQPISMLADSNNNGGLSPLQDTAMNGTDGMHSTEGAAEYEPFPVIQTGPFTHAWDCVWQAVLGLVPSATPATEGFGSAQAINSTASTEQVNAVVA